MIAGHGRAWLRPLAVAGGIAFAVALLGGAATDLGPWYQNLKQPGWKPPDAAFGPAWTVIFALAALSAATAWRAAPSAGTQRWVIAFFALNAGLNVLWSVLFFALQRPDWALIEVGLLWLSILAPLVFVGRFSRPAAWCLLPYLVWVGFAGVLNWAVVALNGPFAKAALSRL